MEIQDPPRSRLPEWRRRRHRRHHRSRSIFSGRGTQYAQWTVVILAAALLGRLVWQGMYSVLHPMRTQVATQSAPLSADGRPLPVDAVPWQRDVLESIEESRAAAQNGNITNAEVAADRAASTMVVARLRSQIATPDFFTVASTALDRALQSQPGNDRLLTHVTDARIELAQLRTWETALPAGSSDVATKSPLNSPDAGDLPFSQNSAQGTAGAATASHEIPGHISVQTPRTLAANLTLTPQMLGGNYLDATLMADSSEILLPPSSRLMTDNVGISDLTISGAAQTLDNMHWRTLRSSAPACVTKAEVLICRMCISSTARSVSPPTSAARASQIQSPSANPRSPSSSSAPSPGANHELF